jgi:chromate reductase
MIRGIIMSRGKINVLGISGSLRKKSYNTAALYAAAKIAPKEMAINIFDIAPIPLYNEDIREQGFPEAVEEFRRQIKNSDAILIVTPEYNYSIPGVLKNAIDWASRPPEQPFDGKPMAIMGASPSVFGSARAQYHLRQAFVYLNPYILNRPEIMISNAASKFDGDGDLTDDKTRDIIKMLLDELVIWTKRFGRD